MASHDDIEDTVDELADALDPPAVERAADMLGITVDNLLQRIVNEVKARISA